MPFTATVAVIVSVARARAFPIDERACEVLLDDLGDRAGDAADDLDAEAGKAIARTLTNAANDRDVRAETGNEFGGRHRVVTRISNLDAALDLTVFYLDDGESGATAEVR